MKKFIAVCLFFCVFFISCSNKKEEVIVFDESFPLALAPDVSWAVVTDPYASYKTAADWSSDADGHCRKGEILQVIGKSTDKDSGVWYSFEQGWLPESCIAIYSNRFKAKTAAAQLTD